MNTLSLWIRRPGVGSVALLALLLLVLLPVTLDVFRLNLVGKYLAYAFVAVGLVILWGWGGILSLGQGVFFGLGGYAMAMFLKLEASDPESTKIQSTPGIPDFMDWNQVTSLPWFWQPFESLPFALVAVVLVPVALAFVLGYAMFKRRVGGVYFAIITQAVALILTVLIIGQQGYTGGVNGITDLKTLAGWDIRTDAAKVTLYYVCAGLLLGCIVLCLWIQRSKFGTLLLAMRDREDRVRFSGYDVAMFKVAAFCLAAALAGIGGALYAHAIRFLSPDQFNIIASIDLLLMVVIGGLGSVHGAFLGAIFLIGMPQAISAFKDVLPAAIAQAPGLKAVIYGAVLIAFVLFEPMGLYGRWLKIRTWFQLFPFYRKGLFKRQKAFQKSDRLR